MPTKNTTVVSARIPDPVAEFYQKRAKAEGRTINSVVGETLVEVANAKVEAGQEPARRMNTKRAGAMNTGPKSRKGERL